jgi:hypothetical protein
MSLPLPLVISNASSITISVYEQFQGFGHMIFRSLHAYE